MLSDYCLPFPPLLVPKGGVSSHRFTELQMYPLHHRKTRSTIAELQSTGSGSGTDTSSERALTKISSSLTCKGKRQDKCHWWGGSGSPEAPSHRQPGAGNAAAHQLGGLQRCTMGVDIFDTFTVLWESPWQLQLRGPWSPCHGITECFGWEGPYP